MPGGASRLQWAFLADPTLQLGAAPGSGEPWLLAVKLAGPSEGVAWLAPGADDGALVGLSDLRFTCVDVGQHLWVAGGSERTAVKK